jgi:hypothetical protein
MLRQEDVLSIHFARDDVNLDEGEKLMREMQELREMLNEYKAIVDTLCDKSKEIIPLKLRRKLLSSPIKTTALCSYKQLRVSCRTLLDL